MLSSRIVPRLTGSTNTRRILRHGPRNAALLQCRARTFQSLTASSCNSSFLGGLSTTFHSLQDDPSFSLHNHPQVRWKRHSGATFTPKRRPWSKQQKKRFRRRMEREQELAKHSAPGSKAGPRREFNEELHKSLIDEHRDRLDGTYQAKQLAASHPLDDPSLDYDANVALLDDVAGNSGKWTAQATPEPIYYGNLQRTFFNRVADQLEIYHEELKALPEGSPTPLHLLPSDQEISLAIRAYRDQRGTKQKPVGIAKALQHVLKDLGIPSTKSFGEYTYNALLTCCRTPTEGIRVFDLMHQQSHQISAYSWAILIDIHAKVGDFDGCVRVLDEMYAEGHEPNLPAYTSLLAACYKVCNDGRIPHAIRAKAGEVGWKKWQELRIKGLEPDVMVYGAILRLCAARGQPERCLNLLEEMPRFDVAPTTLCFSSALKGIARSHETAIRYERGSSKANRRRERIAAHHGKMAYRVVLMAEQAKVELDDGYISALQLCAAAAGDSATAKAIYLAYRVLKNMTHLRTIGGDDHLARLRGESPGDSPMLQLSDGGGGTSAVAKLPFHGRNRVSFQEREYGQDYRTLTAILRACAQACDSNGVGTMWSGRENYGYLDLTSLRLIQELKKPKFRNTQIPGMSKLEVGLGNMEELELLRHPRKRTDPELQKGKRSKYEGIVTVDDPAFTSLDDLSPEMEAEFFEPDGMLKDEFINSGQYPEYERVKENERLLAEKRNELLTQAVQQLQIEGGGETHLYFCEDEKKWIVGHPAEGKLVLQTAVIKQKEVAQLPAGVEADLIQGYGEPLKLIAGHDYNGIEEDEWYFDSDTRKWATRPKRSAVVADSSSADISSRLNAAEETEVNEEWYFDDDVRRWKTRAPSIYPEPVKQIKSARALTPFEEKKVAEARQNRSNDLDLKGNNDETDDDSDDDCDEEGYERFLKAASKIEMTSAGKFQDLTLELEFARFFRFLKDQADDEFSTMDEEEARQFFLLTRNEIESTTPMDAILSLGEPQNNAQKSSSKFGDPVADNEFFQLLEQQGEDGKNLSESDARHIFMTSRDEWESSRPQDAHVDPKAFPTISHQPDASSSGFADTNGAGEENLDGLPTMARGREQPKKAFGDIIDELKDEWGEDGFELESDDWNDDELDDEDEIEMKSDTRPERMPMSLAKSRARDSTQPKKRLMESLKEMEEDFDQEEHFPLSAQSVESFLKENPPAQVHDDMDLEELRQLLPGLPDSRLRGIVEAYQANLSDPSLLTLVPILRETMPDWYTINSLRAANLRNARFVMKNAEKAGIVNGYILNGMLQVYTSTGAIDNALALYEEYDKHNLQPTTYSDRLVIQMFLKHKRFSRCLAFKQKVEERGRKLDILAYGPIIDYCSRHGELGSAVMMLKECIRIHGAPPGEAYLKQLRIICRQAELEDEVGLEGMIGKDPIEWLRHGEAVLKRERSRRGRRDINLLKNAML